jgi:protein-S-isoprenylcysteine O-methyltransferase
MAARRQDWQFAAALVFFHASEYVLAVAFHGRRNVTATCK